MGALRVLIPTLRLLREAEDLPGHHGMLLAARALVRGHEQHFWRVWRMPAQSILPDLVRSSFRSDLAVERARENWRAVVGTPGADRRLVRGQWRKRIEGLVSLSDEQKASLAASLRGEAMLEALSPLQVVVSAVEMPETVVADFAETFRGLFESAMLTGAQDAAATLGLGADWLLKDPAAEKALADYAGYYGDRLSVLVVQEHQQVLREVIIDGLDAGDSTITMGERIRETFSGLSSYQAERIGRTESVRARTEGSRQVYLGQGVQMVEWITAAVPCADCAMREGKLFPATSPDLPPLHPHCLCGVVASEQDLDRMRAQAMGEEAMAAAAETPTAQVITPEVPKAATWLELSKTPPPPEVLAAGPVFPKGPKAVKIPKAKAPRVPRAKVPAPEPPPAAVEPTAEVHPWHKPTTRWQNDDETIWRRQADQEMIQFTRGLPNTSGTPAPGWEDIRAAAPIEKDKVVQAVAQRLEGNADWQAFVKRVPGTGPQYQSAHLSRVNDLIQGWAGTSADDDVRALAMQIAAREEFSLGEKAWMRTLSPSMRDKVGEMLGRNGKAYRAFLRAMHDNTQEWAKENGITHMRLFRGMKYDAGHPPKGLPWDKFKRANAAAVKAGKREMQPLGINMRPHLQPMSSFSANYDTAVGFAYGKGTPHGVVMAMDVPIGRIIGTARSGYGCLGEYEAVVLAGDSEPIAAAIWSLEKDERLAWGKDERLAWGKVISSMAKVAAPK